MASREREQKKFIKNGGHVRGITNLSFYYIDAVCEQLDIGEYVCQVDDSQEVLIFVRDKTESVSSISAVTLLDDRIVALRFGAKILFVYPEYPPSSFATAWAKSVPAAEWMQELSKKSPPAI